MCIQYKGKNRSSYPLSKGSGRDKNYYDIHRGTSYSIIKFINWATIPPFNPIVGSCFGRNKEACFPLIKEVLFVKDRIIRDELKDGFEESISMANQPESGYFSSERQQRK